MKKIHFNLDSTKNYADVQLQIVSELCNYLPDAEHTSTEKNTYLHEAVNIGLFIRQKADVYIGHNLADKNYLWSKGGPGQLAINDFSLVLVPGYWLKKRLERSKSVQLKPEQIIAVGSPRVDMLRRKQQQIPPKSEESKKTVLWAPLHDQWLGENKEALSSYPAFDTYLNQLSGEYEVIAWPHPRNRKNKQALTNDLVRADVVISDYSSVVYEAWALGKPVIFPRWLLGNKVLEKAPASAEAFIFKQNLGYHPHSFEELQQLLQSELSISDDVHAFMESYLDNYREGNASKKIAQHLTFLADEEARAKCVVIKAEAEQHIANKNWLKAEEAYRQLIELSLENADYFNQLAHSLRKQSKWWQEAEALKSAIAIEAYNADWWYRLAEAQEMMQCYQQAAVSYGKAIELKQGKADANWYYRFGYCLERPEQDAPARHKEAMLAYEVAIEKDTAFHAKRFGIGVFHQQRAYWQEAAAAYQEQLKTNPIDAELHYRQGMAWQHGYQWPAAEECYKRALTLDKKPMHWHYCLGYVQEMQEKLANAALAYRYAAENAEPHKAFWFFRLGYVLEKQGCYDEAVRAYLQTHADNKGPLPETDLSSKHSDQHQTYLASLNQSDFFIATLKAYLKDADTDANAWFQLGNAYEAALEWQSAAAAYDKAIALRSLPKADWYYRQGHALARSGQLKAACEAFKKMDFFEGDTTYQTELFGADITSKAKTSVAARKAIAKELKKSRSWNKLSDLLAIELELTGRNNYKAPMVAQYMMASTMADKLGAVEELIAKLPAGIKEHPLVYSQRHKYLVKLARMRWWMNYEYADSTSYGEQLTPEEWVQTLDQLTSYRSALASSDVDVHALCRSEFNVLMIAIHSCYDLGFRDQAERLHLRLNDYFASDNQELIQRLSSLTQAYRCSNSPAVKEEVNKLLESLDVSTFCEYDWLIVEHFLTWAGLLTAALRAREKAVLAFIELAANYQGIGKYKLKPKVYWVSKAILGAVEFEWYGKVDELIQKYGNEFSGQEAFNGAVAYMKLMRYGSVSPLSELYELKQTPLDAEFKAEIWGKSISLVGPAATSYLNGQEIDASDFVVRLNSPGIKQGTDAKKYGSRINIVSFNHEKLKALTVKDESPYSGDDVKYVLHLDSPRYNYPWLKGKKNKPRRERLVDYLFFGKPNHIPHLIFSLVLLSPNKIKLFSMNFFLSEQAYAKEYRADNSLARMIWGDNLIAGFAFVKRMHELGLIQVDETCRPVINLSLVDYLIGMEQTYRPAGRLAD